MRCIVQQLRYYILLDSWKYPLGNVGGQGTLLAHNMYLLYDLSTPYHHTFATWYWKPMYITFSDSSLCFPTHYLLWLWPLWCNLLAAWLNWSPLHFLVYWSFCLVSSSSQCALSVPLEIFTVAFHRGRFLIGLCLFDRLLLVFL